MRKLLLALSLVMFASQSTAHSTASADKYLGFCSSNCSRCSSSNGPYCADGSFCTRISMC